MSLLPVIELFRISQKPHITGGVFSATLSFTDEAASVVETVRKLDNVRFDEIIIGGDELLEEDKIPTQGSSINFILRLPTGSSNKFYNSFTDLLDKAPAISRGILPAEFYLIDDDYFSGALPKRPQLKVLETICSLITALSKLAHYHDEKTEEGCFKLVFIQPKDADQLQPTVLKTIVDIEMLSLTNLDISLVEELCASDAKATPHYNAQVGVFGTTITDFASRKPIEQTAFSYLVQNWEAFVNLYHQNLGTYLSGFAFHKAKREVAEAEISIAEQFSKITSDITGKLLSIPISFAAVIIITKSDSILESSLVVMGLLLAAILVAGAVDNQQRQLQRISHAKNVVLNAFEGKKESFPQELEEALNEMVIGLNSNETNLKHLLNVFRFLSWIPVLFAFTVHIFNVYYKYF